MSRIVRDYIAAAIGRTRATGTSWCRSGHGSLRGGVMSRACYNRVG